MTSQKSGGDNHYELNTLASGLKVITVPMTSTKTVTVLVLVATGSRYETKEINGISHFLEHMMFKGTAKRPGTLDISHELDSIGAEYNAFTSKEYTGYYVKCAATKVDIALDVISDIFQNSKFDAKEIDKERGPIKEEINMYVDHPPRHVGEIFDELIYGDQPLGWNVAGKKETIDQLKRGDFIKYFSSHYFAKNTIVAVAGNINPPETREKIEKFFNNVRQEERLEPMAAADNQKLPALRIEYKKTDQSHINLGFRAYSRFHPKFEALSVLGVILGGGMSSRLFMEVREKRGLAYRVSTGVSAYNETGDFTTHAGLNNDKLIEGLKVILDEHKKLTREKVTEKELTRVKDQVSGLMVIGLEPSDAVASFYAEQELLEHKIETPEQRLAKIVAVTADDIIEVAKDVFRLKRLNLALIGPFEEHDKMVAQVINDWRP